MITKIVPRQAWINCFNDAFISASVEFDVDEVLQELYGIQHWVKNNLDQYEITFTDDKKLTYFILKWL